ncbi:hypothetical protein Tco_0099024 [Tanacetum coccineum]
MSMLEDHSNYINVSESAQDTDNKLRHRRSKLEYKYQDKKTKTSSLALEARWMSFHYVVFVLVRNIGDYEEPSDVGSPGVVVYEYDALLMHLVDPLSPDYMSGLEEPEQAPLSPDYVPGPEYPEYLAPSDEEVPVEHQPYAAADSPIALSPGYIADPDLEEDPEDGSEDGPMDYPADGGDDDDDDSSGDDADDEDEEDLTPLNLGSRGMLNI